jgi:hypothetical protein
LADLEGDGGTGETREAGRDSSAPRASGSDDRRAEGALRLTATVRNPTARVKQIGAASGTSRCDDGGADILRRITSPEKAATNPSTTIPATRAMAQSSNVDEAV